MCFKAVVEIEFHVTDQTLGFNPQVIQELLQSKIRDALGTADTAVVVVRLIPKGYGF
jgi:hypothetical protein